MWFPKIGYSTEVNRNNHTLYMNKLYMEEPSQHSHITLCFTLLLTGLSLERYQIQKPEAQLIGKAVALFLPMLDNATTPWLAKNSVLVGCPLQEDWFWQLWCALNRRRGARSQQKQIAKDHEPLRSGYSTDNRVLKEFIVTNLTCVLACMLSIFILGQWTVRLVF